MYWTYKDLFAKTKSKNLDCIDKKLRRTYTIRNIMEHRYLKVLDSNFMIKPLVIMITYHILLHQMN